MTDRDNQPEPQEVADYVADMAAQLAAMAEAAGLLQTASLLMRAHLSALAELRSLQLAKVAPEDAA